MAEITNLNRFRKQKARADLRAEADANSVKFGRTKSERARDKADAERLQRHLDEHRLDEGRQNGDGAKATPSDEARRDMTPPVKPGTDIK